MKLEVDITCPNCGCKFKQRVENMRPGQTRPCPNCGIEFQFTGDDGRQAQKALDDLERSLKRMFW